MPNNDSIIAGFDRLVARDGTKVIIATTQARVNATDLDRLSRLAGQILADGRLRRGSPVGLIGPNGSGFLAGLIALRRSGHPTALIDSHCTDDEVAGTATALGLTAVMRIRRAWPDRTTDFSLTPFLNEPEVSSAEGLPDGTDIIKLTSGSGGRPRGVAITSDALLADDSALRAVMTIGSGDRLVAMVPFAHSYGLSSLVVPALTRGVTLVLPDASNPLSLIATAAVCEATILPTVPAWLDAWLRLAEPPPLPVSIRSVISAGAPLPIETARQFRRRFGSGVHVFYGTSETGGISYDPGGEAGERGTVGEPIPGVKVTLESIESRGSGNGGRVIIESQAVALSYVPRADGSLGAGRFVSQDLARWRDDELQILGRLDRIMNVRGHKVNPAEVEQAIAKMPGVRAVYVHGMEPSSGGGRCINVVVAGNDGSLTRETIVAWCRARLADYKIPTHVSIVSALPVSPRGKIDRAAIARLRRSPISPDA